MQISLLLRGALGLICCVIGIAQARPASHPLPPFRIADNFYYVGDSYQADYLLVTTQGNILFNSGYAADVANIKRSIAALGYSFKDTKILLISQAHADHVGGGALIKQETGARYMVMDADVPVVESGGKKDFQYGNSADPENFYQATQVDRVLHDGDHVRLGNADLIAHLTGGHTKGCTSWTFNVTDKGKTLAVVIEGGPYANPGYKLVNNPAYPLISQDFQRMFALLKTLPCAIFLGAHGMYFDLDKKYALLAKNTAVNPFIDPQGHQQFIAAAEQAFRQELAKQQIK